MVRWRRAILDWLAYVVVRGAVCLVQALPIEACRGAMRGLAWLLWYVVRLRRDVVEENLAIAFPDAPLWRREEIALGMWEHLLLMMVEIAQAPRKIRRINWREHSQFPRMDLMVRHMIDRRPVIIVSAHLGNFEMGGYLLGLHGFTTHTIARTLDNRRLDAWVNQFRGATGQFILDKHGSGGEIQRVLDRGGTLVLLGDQHAGDAGLWIDFFGKPASTHKAVALFTLGANAPTAVCAALRLDEPLHFELRVADAVDPLEQSFELNDVRRLSQWYTAQLEELIRRAPQQYWWVHRRWKGSPGRGRGGRQIRQEAA